MVKIEQEVDKVKEYLIWVGFHNFMKLIDELGDNTKITS